MRAERDAVKRLALRGEWGPSVDSTMMLFLERLWADCTDASISSFALTPWGQVSAAATLLLMAVTPPHRGNYLSVFSGFPPLITPCSSQAIGSLWDSFSQEQRGFAVAV